MFSLYTSAWIKVKWRHALVIGDSIKFAQWVNKSPVSVLPLPVCVGAFVSSIFSRLWGKQEYRIIIVGLDGAGKTTILNRLQTAETIATIPSIPRRIIRHISILV